MLARDAQQSRRAAVRGARRLSVVLTGVLVLGSVRPVQAGSLARAKRYFRAAETKFEADQYEAAMALYRKAYDEKALPALLINIGQCQRKLGACDKANVSFRRYLAADPQGRHRAKAEALIKACDEELAAARLLEEQQKDAAALAVQPDPAAAPAQPKPAPAPAPASTGLRPLYFWSSVGLAGAMLLTGTVTGGLALKKSSQYNDPETPASERQGLRDSGESLKVAANVTFSIGIAAAVGATVLYFFTDFGGAERPATNAAALGAQPLVGGGGLVTFGGAF